MTNKISPYAILVLAWLMLTTLQAQVEQQPDTLRFDPVTGEPLRPEPVLEFDPLTGLPVEKETEPDTTLQFDPETGLPAKAEPEAPAPPQFDPETGLPVETKPAEPMPEEPPPEEPKPEEIADDEKDKIPPLLSQDLIVDSEGHKYSGTLIEITDTHIHFQFQGRTTPNIISLGSVKRVILADGSIAYEAEPEPVITAEPDTGQNGQQLMRAAGKPFPLQFKMGLSPTGGGNNLGVSYRFSRPIGVKVPSVLGKVMIYPVVTVGFLNANNYSYEASEWWSENVTYGLVEGHRQWESGKGRISLFVGAGLGRYSYRYESNYGYGNYDEGTGIMLSVGAQARLWRLTGDLRLYRTPRLGKFLPMANVGYQPIRKTVVGCAAACGGLLILAMLRF